MMRNKKVILTLIILLIILAICLISFMILLLSGKISISSFNINYKVSDELIFDEVYTDNFSNIVIESNASDIEIKESDDDNIRVSVYGKNENLVVNDDDNDLSINYKGKKCSFICFNMTIGKVVIYLPRGYENNIKIINKYGNIKVSKFPFADIVVDEDYGDIEIESMNNTNIKNKYGDIKIGMVNNATIKESAGDIDIGTVNTGNIENNYGDIKISKVTEYINIDEDCGDVKIDTLDIHKNSFIKNSYGDIKINETSEIYIDAKTSLGDVKINNNYPKSDIILNIKNDCGDIKISN